MLRSPTRRSNSRSAPRNATLLLLVAAVLLVATAFAVASAYPVAGAEGIFPTVEDPSTVAAADGRSVSSTDPADRSDGARAEKPSRPDKPSAADAPPTSEEASGTEDPPPPAEVLPGPTLGDLRSATYQGFGELEPITLADGVWESEPADPDGVAAHRVTLVEDLVRRADLDGDGAEEAVAGLVTAAGASGNFLHLAVLEADGDGLRNLGTVPVGDRVEVMDLSADGDGIVLDLVMAGPRDPMCCPSQKVRRTYALRDGELVETASEELGTFSIADVEGAEWHLEELGWEEEVPDEVGGALPRRPRSRRPLPVPPRPAAAPGQGDGRGKRGAALPAGGVGRSSTAQADGRRARSWSRRSAA